MKSTHILFSTLLLFLSSCTRDEISLGDDFIIYKQETRFFTEIGFDLNNGGGIQGLIDGDIESYGYDSKYVVAKLKDNTFYHFEKAAVKASARPTSMVKRYLDFAQFSELTKNLNLPPLISDGL